MISIILLGVLTLIVLLLLLAMVVKRDYKISVETLINRPSTAVFEFVKLLRNQQYYSKWVMADPNVKMDYRGIDGTVGFIAAWQSEDKNVGVGEQEITNIIEGKGYEVVIRFEKPFKGISRAVTQIESLAPDKVRVTNTFYTRTPYLMNLMIPLIKTMLKKDMAQNMDNLKKVLE